MAYRRVIAFPQSCQRFVEVALTSRNQDDPRAFLRKRLSTGEPNAFAGTGNDDMFVS